MEKEKLLLFYLIFVLLIGVKVKGSHQHHHNHHHHNHHHHHHNRFSGQKLFVFGDSYADTGNLPKAESRSWKQPYGITFPGKPTGRWSNGRVLTDYLASFLGIHTPIAYKWLKLGPRPRRNGMNFAYGGTGVFNTLVPALNLTAQIDLFQQMIQKGVFTKHDVESSIALVSVVGNDYFMYLAQNPTLQGLIAFVNKLINQLSLDLKRLNDLGVKRMAITGLQPVGCLPTINNMASLQKCNTTYNQASKFHNILLGQAVAKINNSSKGLKITVLDLFQAFISILQNPAYQGKLKFENLLKPCCEGINSFHSCGSVDENGKKMYTVCKKPNSHFFWDTVHPTQQGWHAVAEFLQPNFHSIP
ncbi:GDSL esterase/lipase At5g03610-like [Tasmannia lanceolata]|uniref:GDSL esterase/lipase At5g03610-like n=1 Tax=Tasmannia lanceolata TaxID=3420 RepID=UPI0040648543